MERAAPLSPSLLIPEPPRLNMHSAAHPPIRKGGRVSFALRVGSCLALLPKASSVNKGIALVRWPQDVVGGDPFDVHKGREHVQDELPRLDARTLGSRFTHRCALFRETAPASTLTPMRQGRRATMEPARPVRPQHAVFKQLGDDPSRMTRREPKKLVPHREILRRPH
jgi:hypothetical protein